MRDDYRETDGAGIAGSGTAGATDGTAREIRVLLVDDHRLVRSGVKALLQNESDIRIVGEAGGVAMALDLLRDTRPDVCLLDIQLGSENGLDVLPRLPVVSPRTKVIVLSSYLNVSLAQTCTSFGVAGCLVKDTENLDIASAVRVVAAGGVVFDPRVLGIANVEQGGVGSTLSPREMQALGFVCRGLTNAEIASELGVSENTVKGYVSCVMRKLDCDNRVKLVLKAMELKLV